MKITNIPPMDITQILIIGEHLGLKKEAVMTIAIWLVSHEGKRKNLVLKIGSSFTEIEILKDNYKKLFNKLMKDDANKVFYNALLHSGAVKVSYQHK